MGFSVNILALEVFLRVTNVSPKVTSATRLAPLSPLLSEATDPTSQYAIMTSGFSRSFTSDLVEVARLRVKK
jgi:hypothetical protein